MGSNIAASPTETRCWRHSRSGFDRPEVGRDCGRRNCKRTYDSTGQQCVFHRNLQDPERFRSPNSKPANLISLCQFRNTPVGISLRKMSGEGNGPLASAELCQLTRRELRPIVCRMWHFGGVDVVVAHSAIQWPRCRNHFVGAKQTASNGFVFKVGSRRRKRQWGRAEKGRIPCSET
jgi:hypothetical protein